VVIVIKSQIVDTGGGKAPCVWFWARKCQRAKRNTWANWQKIVEFRSLIAEIDAQGRNVINSCRSDFAPSEWFEN